MDMPVYPGDPLTPGVAATPGAKRLALKDATTLTKIPVLPISYGDAQPLLEAIDGRVVPQDWSGGLPMTYHIGPGPATVRLKVAASWDTVRLYDVIARIEGSIAQWMRDQAGPEGRVLAVDMNTRFLAGLVGRNLEVLEADIRTAPVEAESFDVGRAAGRECEMFHGTST